MRLIFHEKVYSDIAEIMSYYERVASPALADEFYRELRQSIRQAHAEPLIFAIRTRDLRRINLAQFPYHLLFRVADDAVRILVVRHHRRNPKLGITRR